MSSIAGFLSPEFQKGQILPASERIAGQMQARLSRRGPDCSYRMTTTEGILMYNGLHTVKNGSDLLPIQGKGALSHLYLLYDGSIYNHKQLCLRLHSHNIRTEELTPPEILLSLYHLYGDAFAGLLRGCFAMAILDTRARQLTLYRDPMGIRPLFYYKQQDLFLFASEIKGLLAHPQVSAATDLRGLHQIFSLGPAHLPGSTIYQGISEVRPGSSLTYGNGCIREARFWSLQARRHEESYEDTIDHAGYLLKNAIQQQYHRQASTCCLLSGGLDSSLVTAMVHVQKPAGYPLATYSFDFADSSRFFSANSFQPSLDRPYVTIMTEHLKSRHTFLECNASQQAGLLTQSVLAHDGPAMADISSSLLYFCHQVSRKHKVAFTGECADEVFGGYPWYHNRMASTPAGFPWSPDLSPRQLLLRDDFLGKLDMENYVRQVYQDAVNTVSFLPEDSPENRRHRQLFVLTTRFFMQTLLDRMDRAASWCGMEALVPFADLDLVEYLYNVPWEMKAKDGDVKHVLKEIAAPYLPADVLQRKKSPYPKNYHPQYEQLLCREMKQILGRRNHPVNRFLDPDKVLAFCQAPMDTHKPWYGQLMAGPQLLAYYLQIDYWLRSYDVTVNI